MYWKTETRNKKFHMVRGDRPNIFWEEYEPDIDTEEYYEGHALIPDFETKKFRYSVVEINEDEI